VIMKMGVILRTFTIRIKAYHNLDVMNKQDLRKCMYILRNNINFLYEIFRFIFPLMQISCHARIYYKDVAEGFTVFQPMFVKYDIKYILVKVNN
jgi:hypothetical protein